MNVSIHLSDEAQPEVRDAIVGPLVAYNTQRTGTNDYRPLVLTVRDEDDLVVSMSVWVTAVSGSSTTIRPGLRATS